jgi:signal transduction histidine kinase
MLQVIPGRNWKTGEYGVRVTVADNGRGIPPDLQPRIFRPFVTTKGDRGTGLGLWVSAGIADRHRGWIHVHSSTRPGRSGTCFVVWLPAPGAALAAGTAG